MMEEPLTIESFFLADYAKVKARNEELENEIREAKAKYDSELPETGFVDLRTPINLVRVEAERGSYSLFDSNNAPMKDFTTEQLQCLIDLDDETLLEKTRNMSTGYSGHVIDIQEKKFPFTVEFKSYKGNKVYAYDPDSYDTDLIRFLDSEASIGDWVVSDFKQECISDALEKVRETLQERIEKLEAEKPKAADAQ